MYSGVRRWSVDVLFFFFSSRRRHTRLQGDWSSDVCSSDLGEIRARPAIGLATSETNQKGDEMKSRTLKCMTTMALLVALTASLRLAAQDLAEHHPQTHYRVVNLGVPLGGSASGAAAINNLGWVAGDSNLAGDASQHAELWVYGY